MPISKLIETEEGQAALARLARNYEDSGHKATVMMCSEKESRKCHRYLISQRLFEDFGINATHIGYNGNTTKHVEIHEKSTVEAIAQEETLSTLVKAHANGKLSGVLQEAASIGM